MTVHIHAPRWCYIGQVRGHGCRRWLTVTRKHAKPEPALAAAVRAMKLFDYRARVLWVGDEPSSYDPHVVMEARRS